MEGKVDHKVMEWRRGRYIIRYRNKGKEGRSQDLGIEEGKVDHKVSE